MTAISIRCSILAWKATCRSTLRTSMTLVWQGELSPLDNIATAARREAAPAVKARWWHRTEHAAQASVLSPRHQRGGDADSARVSEIPDAWQSQNKAGSARRRPEGDRSVS